MVYFTQCVKFCQVNPEICKLQQVLHSLTVGISDGDEWWKYPEYHLKHTHRQLQSCQPEWSTWTFLLVSSRQIIIWSTNPSKKKKRRGTNKKRQTDRQTEGDRKRDREREETKHENDWTNHLVYSSYWQEWEYRSTEEGWNPQDTVVLLVLDRLH